MFVYFLLYAFSIDTALPYYEASELYGIKEVKKLSLDWLHKNTVLKLATSPNHLAQIRYLLFSFVTTELNDVENIF